MKIFIGSSTNYISLNSYGTGIDQAKTKKKPLGKLAKSLREKGYIVEPWREDETLVKGNIILDTLIIKARTCDGGIFVFGKDDKLKGNKKHVSRGNVILEAGMFLSTQGKGNTFILKDGSIRDTDIPTNLAGLILAD